MRILIVYGTSEGQTRKVATFLANRFSDQSHDVTLANIEDVPPSLDPAAYDAVVVAARVHSGRYPSSIRHFVRRNRAVLADRFSAFVSVSLLAAIDTDKTRAATVGYVAGFADKTGWRPPLVHHVAGARFYTRHGAFGRRILGWIDSKAWGKPIDTSRDHEWTDWQALGRFGDAFLAGAQPRQLRDVA